MTKYGSYLDSKEAVAQAHDIEPGKISFSSLQANLAEAHKALMADDPDAYYAALLQIQRTTNAMVQLQEQQQLDG